MAQASEEERERKAASMLAARTGAEGALDIAGLCDDLHALALRDGSHEMGVWVFIARALRERDEAALGMAAEFRTRWGLRPTPRPVRREGSRFTVARITGAGGDQFMGLVFAQARPGPFAQARPGSFVQARLSSVPVHDPSGANPPSAEQVSEARTLLSALAPHLPVHGRWHAAEVLMDGRDRFEPAIYRSFTFRLLAAARLDLPSR